MSQNYDDDDTAKYKLNNNHYNYNYSHYGQMRKTTNNQQVMPLYENYTLNNNNNNNINNNHQPDHVMLERATTESETFNNNYHFVSDTTNTADINEQEACDTNSVTPGYEYENINFGGKESLDKKILLQKYFRCALVGPRSTIYENLCRGCNYGVFNARGPLCAFCECIVNGVSSLKSDTPEISLTTSNNIYENICEYCGVIYSGTNCTECQCCHIEQVKSEESFIGSEELLIEKSKKQKKKVNINKSKSFNKSNKPKIFSSFWETLRKPKITAATNEVNKRPLEIIHHVDGYEHVFHTKDTFDLKKICELKRSGTSCSDQHIYGRLKQNDTSPEVFNSTQSLTQSSRSLSILHGKKPRVSKAKFLRATPSESSVSSDIKVEPNAATIYLNSSVCHWMTSLRSEIHVYNTFNEYDDQETLCYPKSIPAKNVLISYRAPVVTNNTNSFQNITHEQDSDCRDLTEILNATKSHYSMTYRDSWETQEIEKIQQQPDCYQLMVEEFMANIINRRMFKTKDNNKQQIAKVKVEMAGVNNSDSYTNNCNSNCNIDKNIDIPLRQPATMTTTNNNNNSNNQNNNNNNNRYKRQGMYLRLEDHKQLQQQNGEKEIEINSHNNGIKESTQNHNKNCKHKEQSEIQGEVFEIQTENKSECESNAVNSKYLEAISRCTKTSETGWDYIKTDKRRGIHERNILEAFEALLEQEKTNILNPTGEETQNLDDIKSNNETQIAEFQNCTQNLNETSLSLHTFAVNSQSITVHFPKQTLDVKQLINQQQLSTALNTLITCYDKYLNIFLHHIYPTNTKTTRAIVFEIPNKQLVRKFKQFYNYCEKNTERRMKPETTMRELTCVSSKLKLDLNVTNVFNNGQLLAITNNESLNTANDFRQDYCVENKAILKSQENKTTNQKIKTPPQVPKRDPKTKLSPTSEAKRFTDHKMTKPATNLRTETKSDNPQEEESIYQPIWKFETKGKVSERYRTDDDYYDLRALKEKIQQESPNSEIPKILISHDIMLEEVEDHNNWEPDEEFVFTKQMKKQRSSSLTSDRMSTIRSTHSSNSSIGTSSSLSGSTITEFASSTATLASNFSSSLRHYLFRNIGIFYSLTKPKLRAIIYDYDRIHSTKYFAKPALQTVNINDSGIGKSLSPLQTTKLSYTSISASASSSPSTSATSSPVCATKNLNAGKSTNTHNSGVDESNKFSGAKRKVTSVSVSPTSQSIPSSVQAWKYQLLDANYMEDEEDMIVSECEILRAQQIKEDIDQSHPTQPQQFIQRFKSRSTENFLDLPIEDDKKTIAERLANMYTRFSPIQRGILNINGRNSPKSEKKAYKLNRASQSTSLYLEDGLKPKYPIFGAPLDQLELQQNVPRFVVDAVDYIERKDRIIQDGIYRACGNKFSIDELKQKLTKSYIYDSKLIAADDIHTVTSLLKQFFRDLPEPVIPQEVYSRVTTNLNDKQGVDTIRIAIEEMKEPNKSTLRFLIKHLTNVAACSSSNRMNASNVAIVWGPSLFAQNDTYDMIGRMNTLTKVLIENYDRIFDTNERLL